MRKLDRRRFLKATAGVLAGTALAGKVTQAGPNDVLRVAVIGIHGQGRTHLQEFAGAKETMVATICDVDETLLPSAVSHVESVQGKPPAVETDLRRIMEDESIDIVSIATPDHWHALATIWACQAGKDVYVEKPVSHNVREGRKMVEAARQYNRIVQTGTQSRSMRGVQEAIQFVHDGKLGHVYMAKGLCYKPRESIGFQEPKLPPSTLHWDLWLGPAPMQPYHENLVHYNWHWFWDFGTTEMGNQGVHQMDVARWGLNKDHLPRKIHSIGGRWGYQDQGETPNTQLTTFEYGDSVLQFEVRGLYTNHESGVRIGNLFFGSEGWLKINGEQWEARDRKGDLMAEGGDEEDGDSGNHYHNFIQAVLSRKPEHLNAEIREGHLSSALCHLGNISYRVARQIEFNPETETIIDDEEASKLLTREYRYPFVVPEKV